MQAPAIFMNTMETWEKLSVKFVSNWITFLSFYVSNFLHVKWLKIIIYFGAYTWKRYLKSNFLFVNAATVNFRMRTVRSIFSYCYLRCWAESKLTGWNRGDPHSLEKCWASRWTDTTAYSNWSFLRNCTNLHPFLYRSFPLKTLYHTTSFLASAQKDIPRVPSILSVIQSKTRSRTEACCSVCDVLTTDCLVPAYGIIKMEPPLLHEWLFMLLQNSLILEVRYP